MSEQFEHTPSEWEHGVADSLSEESDWHDITSTHHDGHYYPVASYVTAEDARRIVACVNACDAAGLSNAALEGGVLKDLPNAIDDARNDSHASALERFVTLAKEHQFRFGVDAEGCVYFIQSKLFPNEPMCTFDAVKLLESLIANVEEVESRCERFQSLIESKVGTFDAKELMLGGCAKLDSFPFKAPWMNAFGACFINVTDVRRNDGVLEFQVADEQGRPYENGDAWVTADKFYDEWPD